MSVLLLASLPLSEGETARSDDAPSAVRTGGWHTFASSAAEFATSESVQVHEVRADSEEALQFPSTGDIITQVEPFSEAPPTRTSFMASWDSVAGATGYLLDVSANDSFSDYVGGYHDLDVGNVTGRVVTGLTPGATYYYRVRSYPAIGPDSYSETMTGTTVPTTGLIIHATFDSSITGNPNAAAIEAMINRTISINESLFRDPVTIQILFRYATTSPNGTPFPQGTLAQSLSVLYMAPWNVAVDALRADAKTNNDNLAVASLPGSALSTNILAKSGNVRALGGDAPPAMFADGTVGAGGPYDGIITLNLAAPFQFARPTAVGQFDAQRTTAHEMDEVMGLGSRLGHTGNDLRPQDLFSWSSPGIRNLTSGGTRYFSINSGTTNIVGFNQNPVGDFGDWLSEACPQAHPYVQNAFACTGQSSDVRATSPEGVNLDVIGYDLVSAGPTGPPVVTTNPAASIASFSAKLNASLNPHGLSTTFHFEYGTTTSYGLTTAPQSKAGNTSQPVSANINGLAAHTTYHFRIVASNAAGTRFGSDRTFTTLTMTGPPVVTTNPATNVTASSARLNGNLDPHGLSTTVYFQYGTTISYGSRTPNQIKAGNNYQNALASISGLAAHTTYHFRIVGSNTAGTRNGTDRTFRTP